jgi:fructosamine-3-kinase
VEAGGLTALRQAGLRTPEVLLATPHLLVLEPLPARRDEPEVWEGLGRAFAALHTSTASDRFGWHRDGWLGRMRQVNTWTADGHAFFAEHRLLRWLPEPLVTAALDLADRRALERLCARLPEIIPAQPPCLTHGDLWRENILGSDDVGFAVVDPAVSYAWAEVDLSMLWCSPRPPESDRFFAAYAEVASLPDGWRDRMPLLHLREVLSVIAHGDDDWGATAYVRDAVAPFRSRA